MSPSGTPEQCHFLLNKHLMNNLLSFFARNFGLIENNRCLDYFLRPHRLQTLLPLLDFERLVDNASDTNLARR
jgi:hypothetical protein